jgi:succinate-acetate transporter protein
MAQDSPAADGGLASPRVQDLTRVVLRPLATPLPLGFLALAIGSVLLSALQLQWIATSSGAQVATVLLAFVAPIEGLTAIIAFLIRDVVMATLLGLLAGSWATTGLLLKEGTPGLRNATLGLLAIAVATALLVPVVTASLSKPAAAVIGLVAAARFALTGIYELGAPSAWQTATGVVGVILVATALYGSLALALEDAQHRAVLPVSRRSTSRYAMSGDLGHQLDGLPTEAGVRQES